MSGGSPLEATLQILEALVGFDTVSSRSNLPLIEWAQSFLEGQGIECVRVPDATGTKAALYATVGPRVDGGILLSGHTDVVPVTGQDWTGDPFTLRREGDRFYGRGACDMKGFDAICLAMLPRLAAARLTTPIHLLLSYDEEIGCLGPLDTIARFGVDLPRPAVVIVGEPTQMQVVTAHKSISTYRTTVHGAEAHSSNPALGASAIEAACALIGDLYQLQAELEAEGDPSGSFDPAWSTVHVGTIQGGIARNILAKSCCFEWEFRGLPGSDQRRAIDRMDSLAAEVVLPRMRRHAPGATIVTERDLDVPGLAAEPASRAELLAKRLAQTNSVGTASFVTEAGQFQARGLSTVVCGPGSIAQAHQPNEYIEMDQIAAALTFMERLLDVART